MKKKQKKVQQKNYGLLVLYTSQKSTNRSNNRVNSAMQQKQKKIHSSYCNPAKSGRLPQWSRIFFLYIFYLAAAFMFLFFSNFFFHIIKYHQLNYFRDYCVWTSLFKRIVTLRISYACQISSDVTFFSSITKKF